MPDSESLLSIEVRRMALGRQERPLVLRFGRSRFGGSVREMEPSVGALLYQIFFGLP